MQAASTSWKSQRNEFFSRASSGMQEHNCWTQELYENAEPCITTVPEDCQAGSRPKPPLQTKSTGRTHALSHQSGGRTSNLSSNSNLSPQMPFLSRIKSKQLEKVFKTQYILQAIILKPTLSTFCWTSWQWNKKEKWPEIFTTSSRKFSRPFWSISDFT